MYIVVTGTLGIPLLITVHGQTHTYTILLSETSDMFVVNRMRKDELSAISGPNEFAEFYNRLKQIKEFHRKHPNEVVTTNYEMTDWATKSFLEQVFIVILFVCVCVFFLDLRANVSGV